MPHTASKRQWLAFVWWPPRPPTIQYTISQIHEYSHHPVGCAFSKTEVVMAYHQNPYQPTYKKYHEALGLFEVPFRSLRLRNAEVPMAQRHLTRLQPLHRVLEQHGSHPSPQEHGYLKKKLPEKFASIIRKSCTSRDLPSTTSRSGHLDTITHPRQYQSQRL